MTSPGAPSDAVHPLPNSTRVRTLALLLVLIGLFFIWWKEGMPLPIPQRTPQRFAPSSPHIPTEQEWIVGQIGRQIAEMAAFAKTAKGPVALRLDVKATRERPEHYQLQTRMTGTELPLMQLDLNNYIWDPDNFAALASQFLGLRDGTAPSPRSVSDSEIFQRLVRPTPDVLIREDKRLSEALTQHPLDAELHEEAALLIGSFALRHAAACFYDVRRELSWITAHLAIARALDKNTGPCGELAEAILCTLSNRQSAALQILQRLDRNRDTTAGLPMEANTIWNRALAMRNTGDYRTLDQPEHASLLERLEYVRALHYSVSSETASNFLLRFPAERLAEWSHIALGGGFSVDDGHLWTERALKDELEETVTAYRTYHGKGLDSADLTAALNASPTSIREANQENAHVQVLGWGMWAQLHQRQLCEVFSITWRWLHDQWGVPEEAAEFKKAVTERFSGLERFPLVGMETEQDKDAAVENDVRRAKLWQEKPELVPFSFWGGRSLPAWMVRPTTNATQPLYPQLWFSPTFPLGTVYDVTYRAESRLPVMEQTQLDEIKATAPYNNRVLYHHMQKTWRFSPTPEQMAAQFEAVTGYDTWSMEVVANGLQKDPDRYEAAFTPLCRLNPNQYLNLARYLREHHRDEAAVRAYEKAIELARDRVWVSNSMQWLVDYYYTHNRQTDAFRVAEMAAEAYSARGLTTMADLCERAGRLFDAESYFRKDAERYEHWEDLAVFYTRHSKEPKFAGALERLISKIFPEGEERADANTMSGVPENGLVLTTTGKTIQDIGLQPGDVIVAINGVRIRKKSQYFYKMDTALSPQVDLIVWSKRSYRAITANLPNHRLGVDIQDFHPPATR